MNIRSSIGLRYDVSDPLPQKIRLRPHYVKEAAAVDLVYYSESYY